MSHEALDGKVYHRAKLISDAGVSALCFRRPRPIDLAKGESWTLLDSGVTCPRCLALLDASTRRRKR